MAEQSEIYLLRHGETEWSRNGKRPGVTDVPLLEHGRATAARLKAALGKQNFAMVLSSPLQRARQTCELAGGGDKATLEPDLMEWNYGEYEGLTTKQIQQNRPGWSVFHDGCPGGETPEQVSARADRVIAKIRAANGHVAGFAHSHILRGMAARWVNLPVLLGENFLLDTATLNVLGYYYDTAALKIWNAPLNR